MAVAQIASAEALQTGLGTSQATLAWRRFRKHKLAISGVALLIFLFLSAFVGPAFSPYQADEQFVGGAQATALPNATKFFGTDELGHDVMTRLLWAGHVSPALPVLVSGTSFTRGSIPLAKAPIYTHADICGTSAKPACTPRTNYSPGRCARPLNPPAGCRFHTRWWMARDNCRTSAPAFEEKAPGHWSACHFASEVESSRPGYVSTG